MCTQRRHLCAAVRHRLCHPASGAVPRDKLLRDGTLHGLCIFCSRAAVTQGKHGGQELQAEVCSRQGAGAWSCRRLPSCPCLPVFIPLKITGCSRTHSTLAQPDVLGTDKQGRRLLHWQLLGPPVAPGTTTLTSDDLAVVMSVLSSELRGR